MNTEAICRQYDEVIAPNYDRDPQGVTATTLERAIDQLEDAGLLDGSLAPMKVLDLGMGTGMFLERLRARSLRPIEPYGIDISRNMLDEAVKKLPDLNFAVDDVANLDRHFEPGTFDLVSTHFVTGFVPLDHLAPRIRAKLKPGGHWSFVGGTAKSYPQMQKKANNPIVRLMFGGRRIDLSDLILPTDLNAVLSALDVHRFETLSSETFQPALDFPNFDAFMEFAYHGGWLTPFLEQIGLQNAGTKLKAVLNVIVFPFRDCHSIAMAVARKPFDRAGGPTHS